MNELRSLIENIDVSPGQDLGEDMFLAVSSITPMVNVDLLIRDEKNRILLLWRDKMFHFKAGWHIPGGVVRYKERLIDRVFLTARNELGVDVELIEKRPREFFEVIIPELKARGHFISFLFECRLKGDLPEDRMYKGTSAEAGQWVWFDRCPDDMIEVHKMYSFLWQEALS